MVKRRVTPIVISAEAMTRTSALACALASAGSALIVRSHCRSWRRSRIGRWRRQSWRPVRLSGQGRRLSPPLSGNWKWRVTKLIAARRYELVDPAKRNVARELEARWNGALERVGELERRIEDLRAASAEAPKIDRALLLQLAHDLPRAWNAPSTDMRTRQRLVHILVREVVC